MDLEKELGKALQDPEIMNKVGSILSSLSGEEEKEGKEEPSPKLSMPKFQPDDRTRLLLAIKPFLSEKRAPYMDTAVAILSFLKMGKLGKDFNLF